ncbi:hypothetical protein M422DRAFT_240860 [Sphaerobolus stellatus SS14]|nr:hypothetical protein M422DRAFT_240860 [Sphaerobolus stellatus SS14]
MLDQNIHTTVEKSPLAKAGVKVTPPDKYSGEQSFEALETFVKGLLRWLDMHSMLGPDAYKYQVSFLGTRLEGKALEWFDKMVEPGLGRGQGPWASRKSKPKDTPKTSAKPVNPKKCDNLTLHDWMTVYAFTRHEGALEFTQSTLSRKLKNRKDLEAHVEDNPNALSSK